MNKKQVLFSTLDSLGISYQTFTHEPVFTCAEVERIKAALPPHGVIKNLFLKDKKKRYWLLSAVHDTVIKLKELALSLHAPDLRFARPDELLDILQVTPGSVTPFALISDPTHKVTVLLDQRMFTLPIIGIHPLSNDATTLINPHDVVTFINHTGHHKTILDLTV